MVQIIKIIKSTNSQANWKLLRTLMLCGGAGLSGSVNATVLGDAGQTDLQRTTGNAVTAVCGGLKGQGYSVEAANNDPAQDLFNQCNAMIQTAQENEEEGSGSSNQLGIDENQLAGALQNVATEEMATPSRVSMSTLSGQVAEINSHLFDIHKISQAVGGSSGDGDDSLLANRLSIFINGTGGFGDIKSSDREDATDFSSGGVVLGLDYRFTNHFVSGLAFGYSHLDSNFQQNINVSGGGVDADIYNLSIFASYDIANFYVDGTFTYGWSNYDIERSVFILSDNSASQGGTGGEARTAKANADGQQYSAGLGFGYNYNYDAFNINPYFRLDYYHGNIDDYTETGALGLNLAVDEQNFDSLQTLLGVQFAYAFSHAYGVFIPQFNAGWHHEILNNSRSINARYTASDILTTNPTLTALTDDPDRDYATVGFGFSNVFQGGVQIFFNYQALLGYRNISSNGFTGGVRFEF